mmetsp:Transcript_4555/g.5751  ORF Transcript_4555/g.5751 Transcript_4555/m.5751 type:complete len:125 (-) Transcript_4555:115-489(-)
MFGLGRCVGCCSEADATNSELVDQMPTSAAPNFTEENLPGDSMKGAGVLLVNKERSMKLEERQETVIDGDAKYTGQWLGDKRHGHGVRVRIDGQRYEGQFVDDKAHGVGKCVAPNGNTYEGTCH